MKLSLGVRTVDGTDAAAAWEIIAGSIPGRLRIVELGFFLATATASVFGLGRPPDIGITPTTPVDFLQEDPAEILETDLALSALEWVTGPTAPVSFLRRIALPAVIGTGVIWTWPKGLLIPTGGSIVLWNLGTNSVVDAYAVVET